MSHQKVRSYGNGALVYLGKFNIPRLHLPCLSSKKLDHDQTSDLWFTKASDLATATWKIPVLVKLR